ncbi:hypothetical protein [Pandoraea sp.]|uniref:hypothetical protein n=1 Tax=Pandoraea sp. TaxID=1883445 RepID=UPI00120CEAC6|nr:hypothetical protein [Pandoraea sp.]TAL52847.1 MAG: hypothetical protein EPN80_17515 [Pandoraea sp.]TAM19708.1 MAG: hypothetical protein EPN65_02970 [Pandoraea sp.]
MTRADAFVRVALLTLLSLLTTHSALAASCDNDDLESKSDDGSYLIMSSGSVYEVLPGDEIESELWLPPADVVMCSRSVTVQGHQYLVYDIINKDENEKVSAMKRR